MEDTREIGGRIFHRQSWHHKKADAKKEAEWLRKQGNLARVTPRNTVRGFRVGWVVWTSRSRK